MGLVEEWTQETRALSQATTTLIPPGYLAGDASAVEDELDSTDRQIIEILGPGLALPIAYLRHVAAQQSSPLEVAMVLNELGHLLPLRMDQSASNENLPTDDTCPVIPLSDDGIDNHYGSNGDVCITGTASGSYDGTESGGAFGAGGGIFIDLGGDDTYLADSTAFGATEGIFIDLGGKDTYHTLSNDVFGANGGLFLDAAGNDEYDAPYSTGAFGARGGVFVDTSGDDTRHAMDWAYGARGGVFIDGSGEDEYVGGDVTFASTLFDFDDAGQDFPALFVELGGDDSYESAFRSFGHARGTFVEAGGDDTYFGQGQNFAGTFDREGTLSAFLDLGGNDVYVGGAKSFGAWIKTGCQFEGATATPPFEELATFVDLSGNDAYAARENSFGGGGEVVKTCGFGEGGAFFDLGGDDTYAALANSFGYITGQFVDLGGADSYFAEDGILGGPVPVVENTYGGFFLDTEDPAAEGAPQAELHTQAQTIEVPVEIPSPFTQALQEIRDRIEVNIDLQPEVVRLGSRTDYAARLAAPFPVEFSIRDEMRNRWALSPAGTRDELPGIFFPAPDPVQLTATYDALEPGRHDVVLAARDVHGTQNLRKEIRTGLEVDGEPPRMSLAFSDGSGSAALAFYHSEDTDEDGLTITVIDASAGLAALYVEVGAAPVIGEDEPVAGFEVGPDGRGSLEELSHVVALASLAEGVNIIHILAVDAVGWETPAEVAIKVDRSDPEVEIEVRGGAPGNNGWFLEPPEVFANSTDRHSGASRLYYGWDGASSQLETSVFLVPDALGVAITPLTPTAGFEQGASTLSVRVKDAAHTENVAILSEALTVSLDSEAPVTTVSNVPGSTPFSPFTLELDAVDATSGVDNTFYVAWKDGASAPAAFVEGTDVALATSGDWNVQYFSVDVAGNAEDVQVTELRVNNALPVASMSRTPNAPTTATLVSFIDLSTDADGPIASRSWAFGDGATSSSMAPSHRYARPGTYTARLTVTDNDGATAFAEDEIEVANVAPAAAFTFFPAGPSRHEPVRFAESSTDSDGTIVERTWDFGDGSTSTDREPEHAYDAPGDYRVRLTVRDDLRATTSLDRIVGVVPGLPPVPRFSYLPAEPDTLDEVVFTDASEERDTRIASRLWRFGDGVTSTATHPRHQFSQPGSFAVELELTDEFGVKTFNRQTVTVSGFSPAVVFTATPEAPSIGTAVSFEANASDADGIIRTFQWAFGDGQTASGESVSHTYATKGQRTVTLTVTDDDGLTGVASQPITVQNIAPTAAFTFSSGPVYADDEIQFTDGSSDPDGGVITRNWTFGDASHSTSVNPVHAWAAPGTYRVVLLVRDAEGASATAEKNLTILNRAPAAAFRTSLTTAPTGTPITFTDASVDPDGQIASRAWDFDDETTATGPAPAHAFTRPGTYTVRLTVTDNKGATGTTSHDVIMTNRVPAATPTYSPAAPSVGVAVRFTAAGMDPDGEITSYAWTFGDGTTGTGAAPSHTFTRAGTFPVNLTVEDDSGARVSVSFTITVDVGQAEPEPSAEPTRAPVVSFEVAPVRVVGEPIRFTDGSLDADNAIVTYLWSFGDGNESSQASPTHTYADPGDYLVRLTVTDATGLQSFHQQTVHVEGGAEPQDTGVGGDSTPGLAAWGLLAGLVMAVLCLRRRRH